MTSVSSEVQSVTTRIKTHQRCYDNRLGWLVDYNIKLCLFACLHLCNLCLFVCLYVSVDSGECLVGMSWERCSVGGYSAAGNNKTLMLLL